MTTIIRALTVALIGLGSAALAADPATVVYEGKLEDARRRPLSGVYPLTFSLYRTDKSTRAAWSESHYVAVDDGVYSVQLGDQRPIPKGLKLKQAFLGVAVTDGQEILRERLRPDTRPLDEPVAEAAPAPGAHNDRRSDSYAEIAGFAYEADRAKSADSVGGVTADELKRIASRGASKVTIGGNKRYSNSAGGQGGQPYTLKCPKGYVVTGIRGGAAAYVDSLTLICSPLE